MFFCWFAIASRPTTQHNRAHGVRRSHLARAKTCVQASRRESGVAFRERLPSCGIFPQPGVQHASVTVGNPRRAAGGLWRLTAPGVRGGGAEGNRTPDLLIANEALSHLSYGPPRPAGQNHRGQARHLQSRPAPSQCRARATLPLFYRPFCAFPGDVPCSLGAEPVFWQGAPDQASLAGAAFSRGP